MILDFWGFAYRVPTAWDGLLRGSPYNRREEDGPSVKKKKILIIDNDKLLVGFVSDFLLEKGYEVITAYDGIEALEQVRDNAPDCIVLDIVLPKVDGSRVCMFLRQDPKTREIPIIAFSGLGPKDIAAIPELSADAYVAKGPLGIVTNNLYLAIKALEERKRGAGLEKSTFGYEGFRPRQLVSEILAEKGRYVFLLRNMDEGIVETDAEGITIFVNPAAAKILGVAERTLIGKPLSGIFPSDQREAIQKMITSLSSMKKPAEKTHQLLLRGKIVTLSLKALTIDGASIFLATLKR